MFKRYRTKILAHIVFWILYYLCFAYIEGGYDENYSRALKSDIILLPVKLFFCYNLLGFILPRYFKRSDSFRTTVFLLVLIFSSVCILRLTQGFITLPRFYPERPFTPFDLSRFLWGIFELALPSSFLVIFELFVLRYESARKEQELKSEKLTAELSFLKTQLSPHFLFNTLNNIYGLSLINAPETPEVILKLSGLLRFILKNAPSDYIRIQEEVALLESYIELERLRYGERLTFEFKKEVLSNEIVIAPLILLSLVENSFKHGASESLNDPYIHIHLKTSSSQIYFNICNSCEKNKIISEEGIGMKNIQRQLELSYPNRHMLSVKTPPGVYELSLTINL